MSSAEINTNGSFLLQKIFNLVWSNQLRELRPSSIENVEKNEVTCNSSIQDAVLEVSIDCIDKDFDHAIVLNPFIRIHICTEDGRYITTLKEKNTEIPFRAIPYESKIFSDCRGHTLTMKRQNMNGGNENNVTFTWEDRIVINESYKSILNQSTVFLFEILDAKSSKQLQNPLLDVDCSHIAWGFLKPFGHLGNCNIGENLNDMKICRLQLFKYQHNSFFVKHRAKQMDLWSDTNVPQVFLQYLRTNYIPIQQSLYIKVGPVKLENRNEEEKEQSDRSIEGKLQDNNNSFISSNSEHEGKLWMRELDQKCLIPDSLLYKLEPSGSKTLKFSFSGDYLAIATYSMQVCVYEVDSGTPIFISTFHNDQITAVAWSDNDKYLSTASLDGTIAIYKISENLDHGDIDPYNAEKVLVFPFLPASVPTAIIFVSIMDSEYEESKGLPVLISTSDCSLNLWDISKGSFAGELNGTVHHHAPITAITKESLNLRIYSGDAQGCIIIWKLRNRVNLSSITGNEYDVLYRIDGLRNFNGRSIKTIDLNTIGEKQLLVTSSSGNDNHLSIYDFASQTTIPFCSDAKMFKNSFCTAIFSPDGKLVLGGTNHGKIIIMDSSGISNKVSGIYVFPISFYTYTSSNDITTSFL